MLNRLILFLSPRSLTSSITITSSSPLNVYFDHFSINHFQRQLFLTIVLATIKSKVRLNWIYHPFKIINIQIFPSNHHPFYLKLFYTIDMTQLIFRILSGYFGR